MLVRNDFTLQSSHFRNLLSGSRKWLTEYSPFLRHFIITNADFNWINFLLQFFSFNESTNRLVSLGEQRVFRRIAFEMRCVHARYIEKMFIKEGRWRRDTVAKIQWFRFFTYFARQCHFKSWHSPTILSGPHFKTPSISKMKFPGLYRTGKGKSTTRPNTKFCSYHAKLILIS